MKKINIKLNTECAREFVCDKEKKHVIRKGIQCSG